MRVTDVKSYKLIEEKCLEFPVSDYKLIVSLRDFRVRREVDEKCVLLGY
jgi:hypothetical protein